MKQSNIFIVRFFVILAYKKLPDDLVDNSQFQLI